VQELVSRREGLDEKVKVGEATHEDEVKDNPIQGEGPLDVRVQCNVPPLVTITGKLRHPNM